MEKLQLKIVKGDGGDVLFDERGEGVPAFVFGLNLPTFWLHVKLGSFFFKKILNWTLMTSSDL